MNIIISDPKEGKAYSKKTEAPVFTGKKIGESISLDTIGMTGYKAVITGGSDKDGFPMKPSLEGQGRKKLLMEKGVGVRHKVAGMRKRKRVRGNIVAADIHQLNIKITDYGSQKLAELFKKAEDSKAKDGEKKEEPKEEVKKEAPKKEEKKEKTEEAKKEETPVEKREEPKEEEKKE